VVYRATDKNIYELALVNGQWECNNLITASTKPRTFGATWALSDPTVFVSTIGEPSVVYRGLDSNIYKLCLNKSGWYWNNVSNNDGKTPTAVLAMGTPYGYMSGANRVVYLGPDRNIYELEDSKGPWEGHNLSTNNKSASPAPLAAGNPSAYVDPYGVPRVIYKGIDGHIYELRPVPFWMWTDLTKASDGAPLAAGNPVGYVKDVARVIYMATDGQIIELRLDVNWKWASLSTNDKTAPSAPPAAGDPSVDIAQQNAPTVIYRGTDGHIYGLNPEPFWTWTDLCSAPNAAGAPQAAGNPSGYGYWIGNNYIPRVVYRGTDNQVYELSQH
jgi:hypothetical protein